MSGTDSVVEYVGKASHRKKVAKRDSVKWVSEKVDLDEGQARQAVETAVGCLKEKLPELLAGQPEAALEGNRR